jgi:transposase
MSTPAEIADRRAVAHRMSQAGASSREIAIELGVGKDTVRRDLATTTPRQIQRERLAHRLAQAENAVRQACAAAQAVTDATPAYVLADDETARRWYAELCAAAEQLAQQAGAFAAYYPCATG